MLNTHLMFSVELNGVQLFDEPYEERAEAEAFAEGYLLALANNEITSEPGVCEIVTWVLNPESADGAYEGDRQVFTL